MLSEHKGVALIRLWMGWAFPEIYDAEGPDFDEHPDEVEILMGEAARNASYALIAALERGAFPWLRSLDVSITRPNFHSGKVVSQALIDALQGGAPCAATLQSVDLHGMWEVHVADVEELLSDGAILCYSGGCGFGGGKSV